MKSLDMPTWLYLPLKVLLCLGLLSPVFIWTQHVLSSHKSLQASVVATTNTTAEPQSQAKASQTTKAANSTATQLHGIDVSHFQGVINWSLVAKNNVQFAYAKATNGKSFVDPRFAQNWQELRATTIYRGAYHFFLAADDPVEQAKHFVNTMGDLGEHDLPPMLDIEISDHMQANDIEQRALTWLTTVESLTGRTPIVYTDNGFADGILTKPDFAKYPLWIAEYSDTVSTLPKPWQGKKWSLWQHSEKGTINGINGNVDLDIFNGNSDDLKAFIEASKQQ